MKKACFIYNPMSGNRSLPKRLDYIIERFQERGVLLQPYRLLIWDEGNVLEILNNHSYDCLLVSGGDGTVNFIANVILKNGIDLPLGVIPSGTCNDFARNLGIPAPVNKCIDVILKENIIEVDAGLINEERYFLATCAAGQFVDVSFSTDGNMKKNFGPPAYYIKALTSVANIQPFTIKIETESENIKEEVLLFVILNGRHAAGFNNLIDGTDIADGKMDIVLIKNCTHLDLAALFLKAVSSDPINDRNLRVIKARTCRISGSKQILTSIDGEKGYCLPLDITFVNKALKVFAG